MSMRSGSSQRNTGSVQSSGRKQIPVTSSFPLLEPYDIVACLENCGLSITEDTITRPTPHGAKILFEQIADNFCNATRQSLQPRINRVLSVNPDQDQDQDNKDPTPMSDLLTILVLHRSLCKFMVVCDIKGFSLADIQRPEAPRIQRILSAVVNYARFRGELGEVIVDACREGEAHMIRYSKLQQHIETTKAQMVIHEREATAQSARLKIVEQHNKAAEEAMALILRQSNELRAENEELKRQKITLSKRVKDDLEEIAQLTAKIDTDESYLSYSPEEFQDRLAQLQKEIEISETKQLGIEVQIRDWSTTTASLNTIKKDLTACLKIMDEIKAKLDVEVSQFLKLEAVKDLYDSNKMELKSCEARLEISEKELVSTNESVARIDATSAAQKKELDEKVAKLRENLNLTKLDVTINQQDIKQKREYIKRVETKMIWLRSEWDEQFQHMMNLQEKLNVSLERNRQVLSKAVDTIR